MQMCNCRVRLQGRLEHQINKMGVSVAEIAVLRKIHGDDAVIRIRPTVMTKRAHSVELDHLRKEYGDRLIDSLWTGFNPRLPVTLKDIGMAHNSSPDEEDDDPPVPGEGDTDEGDDGNEDGTPAPVVLQEGATA